MTKQKTWSDLLGNDLKFTRVDGRHIVRWHLVNGTVICNVLWTFQDSQRAAEAYEAWVGEQP